MYLAFSAHLAKAAACIWRAFGRATAEARGYSTAQCKRLRNSKNKKKKKVNDIGDGDGGVEYVRVYYFIRSLNLFVKDFYIHVLQQALLQVQLELQLNAILPSLSLFFF